MPLAASVLLGTLVACAHFRSRIPGHPCRAINHLSVSLSPRRDQRPLTSRPARPTSPAMGLSFIPVGDRSEAAFCRVTGAVVLSDRPNQLDASLSPANPKMACPLAAEVATWRREDVEPAAREKLCADVRRIDHLGVYACRNVNNQVDGRPSAHARAAAMMCGLPPERWSADHVAGDCTATGPPTGSCIRYATKPAASSAQPCRPTTTMSTQISCTWKPVPAASAADGGEPQSNIYKLRS